MTHRRIPLIAPGLGLLLAGCPAAKPEPDAGPGELQDDDGDGRPPAAKAPAGLEFTLREGSPDAAPITRPAVAPTTPLGARQIKALLARLPPLEQDPADVKTFALRPASKPPPKTANTVETPFPGPAQGPPPQVDAGPPTVLRHSPDGEVPIAADLSLTFSQPMVALTSRDELAAGEVPVTLTPQPPGAWQWVGTRTLVFRPAVRFPMATEYRIEVPAGVASAAGIKMSSGTSFTFATPAPTLVTAAPRDTTTTRAPAIFLAFDQRIDPAAVLPAIQLLPAAAEPVPLELVPRAEALADPAIRGLVESTEEGRWLVVRPAAPLPADRDVSVVLAAGLPSAEGPRTTAEPQTFRFRTFGPLAVRNAQCGWAFGDCVPGTLFRISFSNPLDARRFDKKWVRVEPELPGLTASVHGDELHVAGKSRANTTYTVTVDGALRDEYRQSLGAATEHTFKVGPTPDNLFAHFDTLAVLDPAAGGKLSVFTTGYADLKVQIFAVTPADWMDYLRYRRTRDEGDMTAAAPPGKPVFSDTIKIEGDPDVLGETRIDLAPALTDGLGHAIVLVETTRPARQLWERHHHLLTWAQATAIGLDAFVDGEQLLAFATALDTGKPLSGVQLELVPSGATATSSAEGLSSFPLPPRGTRVLLARAGADRAFLPDQSGWWSDEPGWRPRSPEPRLLWHVFDDRRLYRPGETVRVKGWLRTLGGGPLGALALPDGAATELRYTLRDSSGDTLLTGTTRPNALGGFDLALALPATPNLGHASLDLEVLAGTMRGQTTSHGLQIQEFRRPEYEVRARADQAPHFVGGHAELTVAAQYFAGGPLAGADVTWAVKASPGSFTPPGRDGFTFGRWRPWWGWEGDFSPHRDHTPPRTFSARTDAAGEHHLRADFLRVTPAEPTSLRAEATVLDVSRQAWTAGVDLLVHPAALYVGLRSERPFVDPGQPLDIDAIVTDLDGKAVPGREVQVRALRLAWEQVGGEWKETPKDVEACDKLSQDVPLRCTFVPKEGGTYRVTADITDAEGRPNHSELTVWVAGGEQPPARNVEQQQVQLIPDKQDYAPGDTARLLVLAPFAPAEGVLTLRREGILSTRRVSLGGASTTLEVPIDEAHTPGVTVQLDLVGAAPRLGASGRPDPALPKRPAFAAGQLRLPVPPRSRTLGLSLTPGVTALEPGGTTSLEVLVRDAQARPVAGSEVAVVVVDEAVLALTDYRLADPLASFYPGREPGVDDRHSRASLVLANPGDVASEGGIDEAYGVGGLGLESKAERVMVEATAASPEEPAADAAPSATRRERSAGEPGRPGPAIALRKNFDALALFAAALPTDAEGRARVEVRVPDNLTRYRVMAVAVAGADRFGAAESAITARLPLMVRPSPPRFLNWGDRFELPIVVQNQTDAPLVVDLAARASNLDLIQGAGLKVQVPAHDRVEVRLPAAAVRPGTARFQVAAAAGTWSDAAAGALPVWTPATTEAFATYGQLDEGALAQAVRPPQDAVPEFGGLELTTSSTALAELTDAVLYLVRYPFECSEQLASRLVSIAALKDVLTAFQAEGLPRPDELAAFVAADIDRLVRLQNPDGGWGFWRSGERSWPYLSAHVAHALGRARDKGFEVPPAALERALEYLQNIESHFEPWYPTDARRPIVAYALHVRQRLGVRDQERARSLYAELALDKHSLETLGWLLPVLGDGDESTAILRHIGNQVRETAGAAHFTTGYSDGGHLLLHSDRRVDGVLLDALIGADPRSDLIPKLVRGLLAHREAGRWNNTQENAFVLLALDRYFAAYEAATPDFLARAWLGNKSAGEHRFHGRSADEQRTFVPMDALLREGPGDLVLAKDGPGRLYYRLGLRYAPKDLSLPPADYGFAVERSYAGIDDPKDVRRDPDGTWRVRAGARVKVTLTMAAQDRRYHVALVDPLPAGLEAINPALATTGTLGQPADDADPTPYRYGWWWSRPWYEHQNLRDERVEAFTSLLWDGVYTYSYTARATTPGTFVVPPARAEEMYAPETFGRSAGDRVIVE